jgi:ankyrin repeat protein
VLSGSSQALEAVGGRPVAHFFCSAIDESLRLPTNILRTCIAQVVHQSTVLLRFAENFLKKSQSGIAAEKELHSLLSAMTNEETGIVVVIDGFDECHEYESEHHRRCRLNRQRFLQQLSSAFVGTASRLILISRDEHDIRSAFCTPDRYTLLEHVVNYGIETTDVHVDIQKFCYAQVESSTSLSQQTDTLRNDVLDHLINGSDGMFLFASLQCALLAQAKNAAQLRRRMEDIPRDLGSFYERYWQRIMGSDDLEQERVLRILRWVTFAAEPLTVPALFEAIALQDKYGKLEISKEWLPMQNITERVARTDLLDACKPFLVLKHSASEESLAGTTVQLGHFSMKAFLTERFKYPEQKKLSSTKNPILAELCVGYLAAGVPWKPIMSTDPCLQSHPLLSYVLFNLTQHFEHGDDTFRHTRKLMLDFYDPVSQYWTNWRDEFERQVNMRDRRLSSNGRPGSRCYYAAAQGLDFVLEQLLAGNANVVNIVGGMYGTPLQVACFNGSVSTVTVLLRHGAAVNLGAGIYGTALHAAVSAGVLVIVETLITHGADASAVNASGRTALLEAIWHEHWSIVPCLISATTRVDLACTFGNTPLSTAAQKGHLETIEMLVERGACVNPDSGSINPLHAACHYGKVAAAALLLRFGANPNVRGSRSRTPLLDAADSGNYAITQVLLDAGADTHATTADGWEALPLASRNGHAKVARALIESGAEAGTCAPDGRTSFLLAVESGHFETVQIYIEMKANPAALCALKSSRVELTTVYYKAAADDNLELVQAFLEAGVHLNHTAFNGNTLLHYAATYGSHRTVRGLLERGADPMIKNHKGRLPLCCAVLHDETEVVKVLLEHISRRSYSSDVLGAALVTAVGRYSTEIIQLLGDVVMASCTTSEKIQEALLVAAESGYIDGIRFLTTMGAKMDGPDVQGRTPLYKAASCRRLQMVEFLLCQGADPQRADSEGMIPLHGAAEAGCPLVIKTLLDGGSQINHMAMGYLTPLAVAARHGDAVKQLLDHGADAHIICHSCDRTLSTILHSRKKITFEMPLAHRRSCTVRWRDQLGRSFIHVAVARGSVCCICASLRVGVSINMPDEQQWTPLHWAAYFGHEALSKWLVQCGADATATDRLNRTPARIASIVGHVTLARSLKPAASSAEDFDDSYETRWPGEF